VKIHEEFIIFGLKSYKTQGGLLNQKLEQANEFISGQSGAGVVIDTFLAKTAPIVESQLTTSTESVATQDIYDFLTLSVNPQSGTHDEHYRLIGDEGYIANDGVGTTYGNVLAWHVNNVTGSRLAGKAISDYVTDAHKLDVYQIDKQAKGPSKTRLVGTADSFQTDSYIGRPVEFYATTGPQAHQGKQLLAEYAKTGDSKYLNRALVLYGVLAQRQDQDGGFIKAPKRDVESEGEERHHLIKSGEENIAVASFLRELTQALEGKKEYKKLSKEIDKQHDSVVSFIYNSIYDKSTESFARGLTDTDEDGVWVKDGFFAIDVLNSLLLEEGAMNISQRIGVEPMLNMWNKKESSEENGGTLVTSTIKLFDKTIITVTGHDWTDKQGRGTRDGVIFLEQTFIDA
ncbi:MAG: hypothetical protein KAR20_01370, partial [Candidatus Heimdallarchaeota archaeon]|nr:hypothetical protein [Candidatus Heimdallarchaeota archaeon]